MAKKRRRSESFDNDAHTQIATFHARPQKKTKEPVIETLNGVCKTNYKEKEADMDEEEPVPFVKFIKTKKEKKKKMVSLVLVKDSRIKIDGITTKLQKKKEKQTIASHSAQNKEEKKDNDVAALLEQEPDGLMHQKKTKKQDKDKEIKRKSSEKHSTQLRDESKNDDNMDALEQALNSVKDQKKKNKQEKAKESKLLRTRIRDLKEEGGNDDEVNPLKQSLKSKIRLEKPQSKKKEKGEKTKTSQLRTKPHKKKGGDDDDVDSFEQTVGRIKEQKKTKKQETKSVQGYTTQHKETGENDSLADPFEQQLHSLDHPKMKKKLAKDKKKKKTSKCYSTQQKKEEEDDDKANLSEQELNKIKDTKLKKKEKTKKTKPLPYHLTQHKDKAENDATIDALEPVLDSFELPNKKKQEKNQKKGKFFKRHLAQQNKKSEDVDGLDALEQALHGRKQRSTKQEVPPHKKHTILAIAVSSAELNKNEKIVQKEKDAIQAAEVGDYCCSISDRSLFRHKKKMKQRNSESKSMSGRLQTNGTEADKAICTVAKAANEAAPIIVETADIAASSTATLPSLKLPAALKRESVTMQPLTQWTQEKPLIVTDMTRSKPSSSTNAAVDSVTVVSKTLKTMPAKKVSAVASITKAITREDEKIAALCMPIANSLVKDAAKKNGIFLPTHETVHQARNISKCAKKAPPRHDAPPLGTASSSESGNELDSDNCNEENSSFYSRLIDSAARDRWELLEVGRLVRLFAAEWNFETTKTAQFLLEICPELVSVDFLEGLGVNLSAKQLVQVFEAGSGNLRVLMNKMASAVENGHLSVQDPTFVSALEQRVALMETNAEVLELLHPLMESLSTVRDVGALLKQLCQHWHLERKIALVQQILLSNVFDDLDGNQDEICLDMPDLFEKLDFPSRLDQEDVDKDGNLKGLVVSEDSELNEDEGSEQEEDDEDSENDVESYEGETDSDEEMEIAGYSRGRHQFIEDEADVGEEGDDEEECEDER